MKRKRIKTRAASRNKKFIKNNQRIIILTAMFVIGSFLGAMSVKNADAELLEKIKNITDNYIIIKSSQSILQSFLSALITDSVFLGLSAIFGLCIIGEPVLWLIPLIRGLGTGLASGYIYKTFSTAGVLYCVAIVYIPTVISVYANILSCKESLITSRELLYSVKENKPISNTDYLKMFFIRNAVLYGLMIFACALGSVLNFFFASKFNLFS